MERREENDGRAGRPSFAAPPPTSTSTNPTRPMASPRPEGEAGGGGPQGTPPPPTGPPAWDGPPPLSAQPLNKGLWEVIRRVPRRLSIRWRLTLTYGALFFAAGVLLETVMYIVLRAVLEAGLVFHLDTPPGVPQWVIDIWEDNIQAQSAVAIDTILDTVVRQSLLALVGVGILALILGYFVADRAMRPVQQMTATARKLSESTLAHQRIALEGPD